MKLSFDEIKSITFGAERIFENDYICFKRFTESEESKYSDNPDFLRKTNATAAIRLDFFTDASAVSFDYKMIRASSRDFVSFDVFINGIFSDTVTYSNAEEKVTDKYTLKFPEGEKRITIFWPNLYNMQVKNFVLDGASFFKPYEHKMKIVSYGDSITQGYDAVFASNSYINQLAIMSDAFVYDKAIGGDIFKPDLIEKKEYTPDIVTVAYGTNDWSKCTREEFLENMSEFIRKVSENYNNSQIFVITPIWRKDREKNVQFGTFDEMVSAIADECLKYENIKVIKGESVLPHNEMLYVKDGLHPNDTGMLLYASGIYKEMVKE